jgi:hypothetical protein
LGEVEGGEMPVSKISLPLSEFPVARLMEEMDDIFRARVELATVNVFWRYARGEHDACIAVASNMGWLNRVFEQAGVPYGPRLEPGSEASKEATGKRKNDSGIRPVGKHVKVSGRKAMALKVPTTPKGMGAASSKAPLAKAAHTKAVSKGSVAPGASVPPKAGAPLRAAVSKITATVTTPKASVTPTFYKNKISCK